MQLSDYQSFETMCLHPVNELLRYEQSPCFTSFPCSTFQKVCAKIQSSVNHPFVMLQRALVPPSHQGGFCPLRPPRSHLVLLKDVFYSNFDFLLTFLLFSQRNLSGNTGIRCWGPRWAKCGTFWSHHHYGTSFVLFGLVYWDEGVNRRSRSGQDKLGETFIRHLQVSLQWHNCLSFKQNTVQLL